jgi:DNA polymerase III sliding clamp (beta) subunit (PCNA family)
MRQRRGNALVAKHNRRTLERHNARTTASVVIIKLIHTIETTRRNEMKAEVNTKSLTAAIQKAASLATSDQETKFCQIEVGEKIVVKAKNRVSQVESFVDGKIEKQGSFGVDSKKLLQLCKASKSETISLSMPAKQLSIKAGNSKAKFAIIESTYFEIDRGDEVLAGGRDLILAASRISKFCGDNESRKNLMGVNFDSNGEIAKLTAADAFRIARVESESKSEFKGVVPKSSINELGGFDLSENAMVYFSDRHILVEDEWGLYKSQLLEAEYPSLDGMIPGENHIQIPIDELLNSLKFMMTLTNESALLAAKFKFSGIKLEIYSKEGDLFEGEDSINLAVESDERQVGINVKYLIDSMEMTGQEILEMQVIDEIKPVKIQGGGVQIVIMPTKLKW